MHALIERMVFDWTVWRLKRKLLRASPALREIEAQERAARRRHKAVRGLAAERSRIVHAQLAREIGRLA